jgi:hypothetical protein
MYHTVPYGTTKIKVVSKSLKRKERNCTFEDLSLRCGTTKMTCGIADLSSSAQHAHLCSKHITVTTDGRIGYCKASFKINKSSKGELYNIKRVHDFRKESFVELEKK